MAQPNNDQEGAGEELWRHSNPKSTRMWAFMETVNKNHGLSLASYDDLYRWSVRNVSHFWSEVWHQTGIKASQTYDNILDGDAAMFPRPPTAPGAKLNFAENLLFPQTDPPASSQALICATESMRYELSWRELRERVRRSRSAMLKIGIKPHDVVAGYVSNQDNAVVAMLAATSLGAIWTGISPDSGTGMVLDRLTQVKPVLLFADASQEYNGKRHDVVPKIDEIVSKLPGLEHVVLFTVDSNEAKDRLQSVQPQSGKSYTFEAFEALSSDDDKLVFDQFDADHPVYVLFSSGTTGAPKCIVHGATGTLLQHKKEHEIHCDIRKGDRVFYYTTCTWMMWHWLVSTLATGATLILYDGSPMRYISEPPASFLRLSEEDPQQQKASKYVSSSVADDLGMPRLVQELQITHFGTSAKYLSILQQKELYPQESPSSVDLKSLRAIYNTASPLSPSTFRYVYKAFGPNINLASITGGTDIVSLFGAPSLLSPVYAGEVQVRGLGMDIRSYTDDGEDVTDRGEPGDLVCVRPFVCQPIGFWPLNNEEGTKRYEKSYFSRFKDLQGKPIWHHGDFVQISPKTGGMVMLGRSDGVLNPAGIRFGSAEIYNVLFKHFGGSVSDGLCVGQRREGDMDETVLLFLKMEDGQTLDVKLVKDIKTKIRNELSARHVPPVVDECPDIPVTVNGKKIEGAVRDIVSGKNVKTSASVANPDCLEWYQQWAQKH